MLDSYLGREESALARLLDRLARVFVERNVPANALTVLALVCGLAAAASFAFGAFLSGWFLLVGSALLDAIDGRVARLGRGASAWGGVLDLVSDRMVEAAVLLALTYPRPDAHLAALFLLATWYVNITVFLAVGAASRTAAGKLIHYPPGLLERSEALVFCSVALLFPVVLRELCILYGLLGLATAAQRLWYGYNALVGRRM